MTKIYQKPSLKYYRRQNRNNPTKAERKLWQYLRKRQLAGFKFQRQYSIENYILDFYCIKARLGIEIDGRYHTTSEAKENDLVKTISLEYLGVKVLRFSNDEVFNNINQVLENIYINLR